MRRFLALATSTLAAAIVTMAAALTAAAAESAPAPDYASQVAPIFKKYCSGCHNDDDREGHFSLESYPSLQAGGEHGPALLPGDAAGSRLVRQLTGIAKPVMPPKDEPRPREAEIAIIKAWIDSGATGPQGAQPDRLALIVPKIAPHAAAHPIAAIDEARDGKSLAVARYAAVELYTNLHKPSAGGLSPNGSIAGDKPQRVLDGFPGKVTAVHFTPDGSRLITASGIPGLGGVAAMWDVESGSLIRQFKGHRDILYDAELSPDGKTLATCSYDKKIQLWNADNGQPLRTFEGHTGAVYDVAFSPDGRFLVSASADDTCKVWRVNDGMRMDTLPQPLKEEYCCTFSPDGRTIVAGGADNNIRVWKFISRDKQEINPMVRARFAHEGPVVRLAFTPDGSKLVSLAEDRTIKVWETANYTELQLWEKQPDVAAALTVAGDGKSFLIGRMDGSLASFAIPAVRPDGDGAPAVKPVAAVPMADGAPMNKFAEQEPNNAPAQSNLVNVPVRITGTISGKVVAGKDAATDEDVDFFRFSAKAGEQWIVEVDAARSKSPLDSFVEVLDVDGQRIERVLLQAVRDSYFTFRGKNDSETGDFRVFNWQEMRLNEYLYANGEVVKLWLYPRGPDSGFLVYPGQGSRWGYFDTTPLSHALGDPCYIVQPHPPGTKLIANGLPVFPLYYENDDDSHRELGKDSRLLFTAPADGQYLVKIKDVRGLEGADFKYTLTIRPRHPDFQVTMNAAKLEVGAGSAEEFKVTAKRIDGYEGPIRVDVDGLPPGFTVTTPLVIEAGQIESLGVIAAAADAPKPTPEQAKAVKVTASAAIWDREVSHPANNPGEIKLTEKPKLYLTIVAAEGGAKPLNASPAGTGLTSPAGTGTNGPPEFEIYPGETIMLKVKVERAGHVGSVAFGTEGCGRNLPFGVIVDNIGLNGLLIPEDQQERNFFITADRCAAEQTRPFHLITAAAGGVSSGPIMLHVRPGKIESAGE
jgi:mono/diheme cytochrome c family protein